MTRQRAVARLIAFAALWPLPSEATGPLGELPGWKAVSKAEHYTRGTVYQAINGAAELYLGYGMRTLDMRAYARGEVEISVQVFDQQLPLFAFGVFRRERPEGGKALPLGSEAAFVAPDGCAAFKGAHYVRIRPQVGDLTEKLCADLLGTVLAPLPGPAGVPAEVALLPTHRRAPESVRFTRESYLGARDLRNCVHAEYTTAAGKESHRLFVMVATEGDSLEARWAGLGKSWEPEKTEGLEVLTRKLPYQGFVVLGKLGGQIVGAAGFEAVSPAARALREGFLPEQPQKGGK